MTSKQKLFSMENEMAENEISGGRKNLVLCAKAMLCDKIHLLEGCRIICSLRFDVDPDSPIFFPFRGVDSETDHYPLGDARKWGAEDYLKRIDKEIEEYLEDMRPDILEACNKVIDAYDF